MREAVARPPGLLNALLLLTSVWTILVLCQLLLGPLLGSDTAVAISFGLAALLVLAAADPHGRERPKTAAAPFALACAAGFSSLPAWVGLIAATGTGLGLAEPIPAEARPGPLLAGASVLLAPVFEELLYRDHLLGALRPRIGAVGAALVASLAFAAPHFEAWSVLGTFLVGLVLGCVRCLAGSVGVCIGLHGGLNLAVFLCDLPPSRLSLAPGPSAICGLVLLAAAIGLARMQATLSEPGTTLAEARS